jgi:spore germination protein GerM
VKRARVLAGLAGSVLAAAGLCACAIPNDAQPRDISPNERLAVAASTPAAVGGAASGQKVFFLSNKNPGGADRLQQTSRDVPATPDAVLRALLRGLTNDERDRRWQTAIPSDTNLLSASLDGEGTVMVNLSKEFFVATGDLQIKAVAQVVFTATSIEGAKRVRILIEGQKSPWLRGDGTLQDPDEPLTPFAYPDLNPSSQPDYPPQPAAPAASTTSIARPVEPHNVS